MPLLQIKKCFFFRTLIPKMAFNIHQRALCSHQSPEVPLYTSDFGMCISTPNRVSGVQMFACRLRWETVAAGCLILEQNTGFSFPFAINSHNAVLRWMTCDISKVFGVTRNRMVFSQYSTQAFSIVCCTAFRTAAKHPRCHKWTFISCLCF